MKARPLKTAFLDASVLYPALLRNLLMYFGAADLYRPRWSAQVHAEWTAALKRNRPDIPASQIDRTRALMDAQFEEASVAGFEHHIAAITLPDIDDRHVLAAALHSEAQIIVTANLRDFPAEALAPFSIVAQPPDIFLTNLVTEDPTEAVDVFMRLCGDYKHPPQTTADVTALMQRQELSICADVLNSLIETELR